MNDFQRMMELTGPGGLTIKYHADMASFSAIIDIIAFYDVRLKLDFDPLGGDPISLRKAVIKALMDFLKELGDVNAIEYKEPAQGAE